VFGYGIKLYVMKPFYSWSNFMCLVVELKREYIPNIQNALIPSNQWNMVEPLANHHRVEQKKDWLNLTRATQNLSVL
jgi:hypothetical protein